MRAAIPWATALLGVACYGPDVAPVDPSACAFIDVAAGGNFSCAVRGTGEVFCWGSNEGGQIDFERSPGEYALVPTPVPGLPPARAVSAGGAFVCLLTAEGEVHCWGENDEFQLGSTETGRVGPIPVPLEERAVTLEAGHSHICVLTESDRVLCWGDNGLGQIGNGDASSADRAVPTPVPIADVTDLSSANDFSCAISANQTYCWGANEQQQLGTAFAGASSGLPIAVAGGSGVDVEVGGHHACVMTAAGAVLCWGNNSQGQLARGPDVIASPIPTPDSALFEATVQLSLGHDFSCVVTTTKEVSCAGANLHGQLGNNNVGSTAEPDHVGLPSGTEVTKVSASTSFDSPMGGEHACALTSLGQVRCWGANYAGQLGDGSSTERHSPAWIVEPACP